MIIVATKKIAQQFGPPPILLLLLDPGSEIPDPLPGMDKNQDPG
jgi:hypothetical protein